MSLLRLSRSMALRSSQPALVRAMSATTFHDKEKAAEKQYFNVEDEKLLRRLLAKVKDERSVSDKPATAAIKSVELQRLEAVVGKYNISPADIDALIQWRHSHEF